MNTLTPEHTPTFDTLHAVGGMADAVTPKPSNRPTFTFKTPAPSTKPPHPQPTPPLGPAGATPRAKPPPPTVAELMSGARTATPRARSGARARGRARTPRTPREREREPPTEAMARFFRARSARLDSPIFAAQPRDFACTNPEVRFCPDYREHAHVPDSIPCRELLSLRFDATDGLERSKQVDIGYAAARNPVAYSMRVDFPNGAVPARAKVNVLPESINQMFVLARPEYTKEEQEEMYAAETEAYEKRKPQPAPIDKWFWCNPAAEESDADALNVDYAADDHFVLKFWAAPCRKAMRGEATVELIVEDALGERWVCEIHLTAMGCEPHMRVVGDGVKPIFDDAGSSKVIFRNTNDAQQAIFVRNDCPHHSPLLISVLLVEDGIYMGRRPNAFELIHVEEEAVTNEVVKLLPAGDSLPLLINFSVPPNTTIPVCYHAYMQVRIAYFLQSHFAQTADEELPHYYDHVVYIEAPREDGVPIGVPSPTPTPSITPSTTPVRSIRSATHSRTRTHSVRSETFPDKLDFSVDEHSESIFGEETTVEIFDDANTATAAPAESSADKALRLVDVEEDDLVPDDDDDDDKSTAESNSDAVEEKPSEEVERVREVSDFDSAQVNEDVEAVLEENEEDDKVHETLHNGSGGEDDDSADSFAREDEEDVVDDRVQIEEDEDDYQSESEEEEADREVSGQLDGVKQKEADENLDEAVELQTEEYMKFVTDGLGATKIEDDDDTDAHQHHQWKHNSPTDIIPEAVPVNHPPEPVKLRMPRSIREKGLVLRAEQKCISLVLQNGSGHKVDLSVHVRSELKTSLEVDRPERIVEPHANCKFRLRRTSDVEAVGELVVLASCVDDALSVPGRNYALQVVVEGTGGGGGAGALASASASKPQPQPKRRARLERMIMDRPTLTFYREAGACTLRVSNCSEEPGRIEATLCDVVETQRRQTTDEYDYPFRNPFTCVTPACMLKRNYMAEFTVHFKPEACARRAAHYTGMLAIDADGVRDAVPIFAYTGAAHMRCSVTKEGEVVVENSGVRAGFFLARGADDCKGTAAVLAPQEKRVLKVPSGWDGQLHVGDEIARSRMRHAAAERVVMRRELAPFADFLRPFDDDEEARLAEGLTWTGVSVGTNLLALHYATRLFGATLTVHQMAEAGHTFTRVEQNESDMWDAWYEDQRHVRIINQSAKTELKYVCTGAEPSEGTVPVLGDALVTTQLAFVIFTARNREATISRE